MNEREDLRYGFSYNRCYICLLVILYNTYFRVYHKLFTVVYFDSVKGFLREFIIAAIVGMILTTLSITKPIIGIIVIIIIALIGMRRMLQQVFQLPTEVVKRKHESDI